MPDMFSLGFWRPDFVSSNDYPMTPRGHFAFDGDPFDAEFDELALQWYYEVASRTKMVLTKKGSFSVRSPYCHYKNAFRFLPIQKWHHDNSKDSKHFYDWMILWASSQPTEIEMHKDDGTPFVWQPMPFEILAMRNNVFRHRSPQLDPSQPRWFARGYAFS